MSKTVFRTATKPTPTSTGATITNVAAMDLPTHCIICNASSLDFLCPI
jgi:hypothetical protein